MRLNILVAMAVIMLSAQVAKAELSVAVDGGYAHAFGTNGSHGLNGFGLDAFVGYRVFKGPVVSLIPELQIGVNRYTQETFGIKTTTRFIPVLLGARVPLDLHLPVRLFGAAHLGMGQFTASVGSLSADTTKFSFNVGAGADYLINKNFALGLAAFYNVLVDDISFKQLLIGLNFHWLM